MNPHLPQSFRDRAKTTFGYVPAVYLNAGSAALGVGVIGLVLAATAGQLQAQLALSGAICASLSDVPGTVDRIRRRVMLAATLSLFAALVIQTTRQSESGLVLGIFAIGFVAMMAMSWGAWATSVSFAPLLCAVFTMATPAGVEGTCRVAGWNAVGGFLYLGWAIGTGTLLQRRFQAQALSDAINSVADLLRARGALLESSRVHGTPLSAMQAWVQGETTLAERLQAARDFVFSKSDNATARRHSAMLLATVEMRDVLLAARLDLDLVGVDHVGREIFHRLADALRAIAADLEESAGALLQSGPPALGPARLDFSTLFDDLAVGQGDSRLRLLPSLHDRLETLVAGASDIRALLSCAPHHPLIRQRDLKRFVAAESWPMLAIREQLHWTSPVFRHALRMGCAMSCAFVVGQRLPWASHPYWLVLSVAVVLRGNLEQTIARRNARVFGTMVGCAAVAVISMIHVDWALELIFLAAVGVAHAFITRRYWPTAVAATVMALLQSHLIMPSSGFFVEERAADTLLGALLAWAFSYVLPSWERRHLPGSIKGALADIGTYAEHVLRLASLNSVALRLARRRAYDSLSAVSDSLQRSSVEPRAVRIPLAEIAELLDYCQRMMAHLSMIRVMLARDGPQLHTLAVANRIAVAALSIHRMLLDGAVNEAPSIPDIHRVGDQAALLPEQSIHESVLPWFYRRLDILVSDASRTRSAAQSAIVKLDAQQSSSA